MLNSYPFWAALITLACFSPQRTTLCHSVLSDDPLAGFMKKKGLDSDVPGLLVAFLISPIFVGSKRESSDSIVFELLINTVNTTIDPREIWYQRDDLYLINSRTLISGSRPRFPTMITLLTPKPPRGRAAPPAEKNYYKCDYGAINLQIAVNNSK